jgi:hypothetical protein
LRRLQARAVEANAAAALAMEGTTPVTDPVGELGRLAARLLATERALSERVNALTSITYLNPAGTEQLRGELFLWGQFQDRLTKVLAVLAKSGIYEREEREAIKVATALATIVKGAMARVDLPEPWRANLITATEQLQTMNPEGLEL